MNGPVTLLGIWVASTQMRDRLMTLLVNEDFQALVPSVVTHENIVPDWMAK